MKRILALTLTLASIGFIGSFRDVMATTSGVGTNTAMAVSPQIRIRIGGRRRHDRRYERRYENGYRGFRTVTQTRLVRRGWATYRETYAIRYFPNGRIETSLISRVRIS